MQPVLTIAVGAARDSTTGIEVHRPPSDVTVYGPAAHAECVERLIVLEMAGIRGEMTRRGDRFTVDVNSGDAGAASEELERHEEREHGRHPDSTAFPEVSNGWSGTLAYAAVIAGVFVLQNYDAFAPELKSAGMAHAGLIRAGDWWRAMTALTLHADLQHLASNLAFGGLFGLLCGRRFG
ncbi:MAG: hypothetical protein ACR2RL_20485, partial [Gammaproteobacteria bacterium]